MKKLISIFATLLFFASVTVFTLPMMQNDANADLSLTEKVTIMANAGDGGGGNGDNPCPDGDSWECWFILEFNDCFLAYGCFYALCVGGCEDQN